MQNSLKLSFLKLTFVLAVWAVSILTHADDDTLIITDETHSYDTENYIHWRENENTLLSEIINSPDDYPFIHLNKEKPTLRFRNTDHWIKFNIINKSHNAEFILAHQYPNVNYLDFYLVDSNGITIKTVQTGNLRAMSSRDIFHRLFLFDIELHQDQVYTIYLRQNSQSSSIIDLNLYKKTEFIIKDDIRAHIFGIYYGFVFLIIISGLITCCNFKSTEHYFATGFVFLFCLCIAFFDGHAQLVLPDGFYPITPYVIAICFCASLGCFVSYWQKMLNLRSSTSLSKTTTYLIYFWFLLAALQLIIPYRVGLILILLTFVLSTPYFIISTIISRRQSSPAIDIALAGLIVFYSGCALSMLQGSNYLTSPSIVFFGFHVSTLLLVCFLFWSAVIHFKWLQTIRARERQDFSDTKTRLQMFVDQRSHYLCLLTSNGTTIEMNQAARDLENLTSDQIPSFSFKTQSFFGKGADNSLKLSSAVDNAMHGKSVRLELKPDDQDKTFSLDIRPFHSDENTTNIVIDATDITDIKSASDTIDSISLGISEKVGSKFFEQLVKQLSNLTGANIVLLGVFEECCYDSISVVSGFSPEGAIGKCSLDLANTPFEHIKKKQAHLVQSGVTDAYSTFSLLKQHKPEGYLGVPLVDSKNTLIGLLGIFTPGPLENIDDINRILQIFISRAEAELERSLVISALKSATKRLSLHKENTPLAVVELDNNLDITDWNFAAEVTFGFKRNEVIGKNAVRLLTSEKEYDEDDAWQLMISNRDGHYSRLKNRTASGDIIICDWHNTLLIDDNGEMFGVASLIANVTREQKALEMIRHQDIEKSEILDFMLDAVVSIDQHGTILSFNQAAVELFGFDQNDAIDKNVTILMPEHDANNHHNYVNHYINTGEESIIGIGREVTAQKSDGSQFPMRLSVAELPNHGTTRRFIASCQDLTIVKQREEKLRRTQKMDALGKLTGGVAHDFNNLLGVIMGYSDLLTNFLHENPKLLRYSEEIHKACERGSKLTTKLLSFSRQQLPAASRVDLNKLLSDSQNMLERVLTSGIQLSLTLDPSLHSVRLDKNELEDALLNMCINASHAMDAQGNIWMVTQNTAIDGELAENLQLKPGVYSSIKIQDSGCGIDEDSLANIFDPFFTTKGDEGTGLGLSQVYGFVKRCGGTIAVQSEVGKGTEFTLYFPPCDKTELSSTPETKNIRPNINGNESVLLVDDEFALLEVTKIAMTACGYKVHSAENAQKALDILVNTPIDVMLSDVVMPEMDGYALASRVQIDYPDIKILLASGFTDNLQEKHKDVDVPVIPKPFKPKDVMLRIRAILDD